MILTKEVEIRINNRQVKYYKEKGYKNFKGGDILTIKVEDLPNSSHTKIKTECDNCKKIKEITFYNYKININNGGYYLCSECKNIKTEKTNLERYGVKTTLLDKTTQNKIKHTIKERYGVEHYSQTEEYKEKMINHNLEKYGVKTYFESEQIKKDRLNKFGVEYYSQTEEFKIKYKNTILERYGVEHYSQTIEFKNKIKNNYILNSDLNIIDYSKDILTILCDKGHTYTTHKWLLKNRINKYQTNPCTVCNPINSNTISGLEMKLLNFIKKNYDGKIITSDRKILNGKELDIYIPKLKIAIEFNGLYWHNELHKDNKYHLNKTELCLEKGIKLIHIWEDDWNNKEKMIKSILLNNLKKTNYKIYGRKTKIREISDNKLVKKFLNKNHLQGFIDSKINLGLFYNDELVSLMVFVKNKTTEDNKQNTHNYKLLRYCSKLNTNVIGGASKLIKFFINKFNPETIITYVDRSYSQGNLYEKIGFNFIHKTSSNYYYIINNIRYPKDIFKKDSHNKNRTEDEIISEKNIYKIFDSGNLIYQFKNTINSKKHTKNNIIING